MRSPPYSERSLKIEGRDYLVQDRDCIHFRFNVCFHRRATARLKVDWIAASARVTLDARESERGAYPASFTIETPNSSA